MCKVEDLADRGRYTSFSKPGIDISSKYKFTPLAYRMPNLIRLHLRIRMDGMPHGTMLFPDLPSIYSMGNIPGKPDEKHNALYGLRTAPYLQSLDIHDNYSVIQSRVCPNLQ
ncbi:hypothetical protein FRC18_001548 [Serendipita sp. 400]|nr:hypothetical protein FRC18_001548 [Serendipita sp. 400]